MASRPVKRRRLLTDSDAPSETDEGDSGGSAPSSPAPRAASGDPASSPARGSPSGNAVSSQSAAARESVLSSEDERMIDEMLSMEDEEASRPPARRNHSFSDDDSQDDEDFAARDMPISQARAEESLNEDEDCPPYLRAGFMRTHEALCNKGTYIFELPMDNVPDQYSVLTIAPEHERTMDSASKCFRVVPRDDLSHYLQPYEGYYHCYMDRCNSVNLSQHATLVLYFYRELLSYIKANGLTNYAIPLSHQSLRRSKKRDSGVLGLSENIVGGESYYDGMPDVDDGLVSITKALNDRDHQKGLEHQLERDAFTIRVAFTGAMYKLVDPSEPGEFSSKQELFCVVIVTPNAGFDMHSYITDFLQTPPKNPGYKEHWAELQLCYKQIQMFEVNNNCGLFCDPAKYDNDVGGKGGVVSVLSMLNLPYRMAHVVQKMAPHGLRVTDFSVLGMPVLSYTRDDVMSAYEKYMHTYISKQAELHNSFLHHSKVFYAASDTQQADLAFDLPSSGGWPLKHVRDAADNRQVFLRFGLFKFPIVMDYMPQRFVERMTKESFFLNLGTLPLSVEKKNRDFKTFDADSAGRGMMPDAQILTSTTLATPWEILTTYYGPNARPEDDFRDDKLIKWFEATRLHIESLMARGEMTPEEAMAQIETHLDSCLEQHRCILDNDGYGSHHFEQCRKITKGVHDTKLATVSVEALLDVLREDVVPESIRHDPFLSTSFSLLYQWQDYNKEGRLNATNLEAAIEIMLSSLLWVLGSHHHSIIPFFQGVLIISNRGHNEMLIDKQFFIDWRKPNTTGAGAIQERLNKMLEELGLCYRIMRGRDNKIVFVNPNRSTEVSLEQESCVVTVTTGGMPEVQSRPSPALKYMPLLMLELRGSSSLDNYIRLVFPRDAAARNIITTTVDPKNTNDRKVALKEQIVNPCVAGMCTNQKRGTDEPKTIICVTHVCDPGAPAFKRLEDPGCELNDVKCEVNDGRSKLPKGDRLLLLLKSIFFSHVFAKVDVALLHRSGALPYSIGFATSAALDWFYMIIKEHLFCVFNPVMIENFGRVRVSLPFSRALLARP